MSHIPILSAQNSLRLKLHTLIQRTPLDLRSTLSESLSSKIIKVSDSSLTIEPFAILMDLIHKSSIGPRKNWKLEETHYLIYVIDKYCKVNQLDLDSLDFMDWQTISEFLPGRSATCCQFRFLALAPSSITNTPWSSHERQLLLRIIQSQQQEGVSWKKVSQHLYELNPSKLFRTSKQCRQHYTCFLRPNLKKGPWTDREDYQLICLFLNQGKRWSKIAKYIDGRNENSIKNRFFLMFQNKKEGKISNSDLTKIVKRRKDKLQKKMSKESISDSLEQSLSSQYRVEPLRTETNDCQLSNPFHEDQPLQDNSDNIFAQNTSQRCLPNKNELFFDNSSEQIEKYISF